MSFNKFISNRKKKRKNKKEKRLAKKQAKYNKIIEKEINRSSFMNFIYKVGRFIKNLFSHTIKICTVAIILAIVIGVVGYIHAEPIIKEVRENEYDKLLNCNAQTFQLKANTIVYDKSGNKIGTINSGNYIDCKVENVSPYLKEGYIAVEDKNFKVHPGIDLKAITRAGLALVKNKGEITQGASTITQQVVKNNLLTRDRTYLRKATEILLALDIEKEFNKSQIMEFYLNTNFYGHNCYGVGAASYYYFGCTPSELSPSQAAILMGISNAPTKYDPVSNYDNAIKNKNFILKAMLDEKVITKKQYDKGLKEKVKIQQNSFDTDNSTSYQVTYALHCATLELMRKDGFNFKYVFDTKKEQTDYEKKYSKSYQKKYDEIKSGGYKIYTSLDNKIQKKLQKSVDSNLSNYTEKTDKGIYKMQGSAVCIDNDTNYVVAIVGGRNKSGEYNRAYQAARQPGSSIKPVVSYGPAFDTGLYYPSKRINNTAVNDTYAPKNWDGVYTSSQSIREAIYHSTNVVAYRTLREIGIDTGLDYLSKMKFSTLSYADRHNYAIALGGFTNGVSPVDMAKAYNTIYNNGKYSERTCIKSIVTSEGEIYSTASENTKDVYNADSSYMLKSCMKDVVARGTGTLAKVNDQVVAGKTGTTNSNKDAWFCGFSNYYTTTVWVGYDNPTTLSDTSMSAKIFSDFMTDVSKNKEKTDFERPDTTVLKYTNNGEPGSEVKNDYYKKSIDYSVMDYFSTKKAQGLSAERKQELKDELYEKALKAVKKFENYKINDINSAVAFVDTYNKTLKAINKVDDEYKRSELSLRLQNRYQDLLLVYNEWAKYINEYNEEKESKDTAEREVNDNNYKNQAIKNLKNTRIENVEFYINKLYSLEYYDQTTVDIMNYANEALSKLQNYNIYSEYKDKVEKAINYAKKLPEQTLSYENETETKVTEDSLKKKLKK